MLMVIAAFDWTMNVTGEAMFWFDRGREEVQKALFLKMHSLCYNQMLLQHEQLFRKLQNVDLIYQPDSQPLILEVQNAFQYLKDLTARRDANLASARRGAPSAGSCSTGACLAASTHADGRGRTCR